MLLKHTTLAAIAEGSLDTVFRCWEAPRVKAGSTLKTRVGVLEITAVDRISKSKVTSDDAKRAGYASRAEALADIARFEGNAYRIRLRRVGEDPRVRLRNDASMSKAEREELLGRVMRLGARAESGPWGLSYLRLIRDNPGRRAPDLAAGEGLETAFFKARVRQLKELGLTESLKIGYRLSPRGRALLSGV